MSRHRLEINTFNGENVTVTYKTIIICNKNIKEAFLSGKIKIQAEEPYIIITNNKFADDKVDVLEDATITECLKLYKMKPLFGGIVS